MKSFGIILVCLFSGLLGANHDHFTRKQIGEYYEFDTEGTRMDRICHSLVFHTKQVAKFPFHAASFCFHTSKNVITRTIHEIELFLSPSRSIHGHRVQLREALGEWASDPIVENYLIERDRDAGRNCLLGIPKDVFALLKNSLYAVGIRLPKATWRTLKSFVHGTCDCARI